MPLNSVQLYIQGLLDGLVIPTIPKPLTAYITPPTVEDADGPKAYVWGARLLGSRQTAPRPVAFKHLSWTVDVYLSYETLPPNPNDPSENVDQEFPLIIDAVMAKTWYTAPMPTIITDPSTGVTSQILAIGEQFQLEYPPERTPSSLRMLYYTARLGFDVYEAVQG